MSDNIISLADARDRRKAAASTWVSLALTISADAIDAWLTTDPGEPAPLINEKLATFTNHPDAARRGMEMARERGLQLVDHTAVYCRGVWDLRPVATGIYVFNATDGRYAIHIRPDDGEWTAFAGYYPNLDVVGDRAVELSERLGLRIYDRVKHLTSLLGDAGDDLPDGAA